VATQLASIDVPQADRLEAIRELVRAVGSGFRSPEDLGREADLSDRHVAYYLQAARILGLLALKPEIRMLPLGERLLATTTGGLEEAEIFRAAVQANRALLDVTGDFLTNTEDRATVSARLQGATDLSPATADRRARTLVAWRESLSSHSHARVAVPGAVAPATPPSPPAPVAAEPLISDQTRMLLENQMRKGKLVLMTGAGFSAGAVDPAGRPLPVGAALAKEIWKIAFPEKPYEDGSALGDIFAVALVRNKTALQTHLAERLSVDPVRLPDYYRTWYALPWRKSYTLNQDNLDVAVGTRFDLPRKLIPVSAAPGSAYRQDKGGRDGLRVIHLNGVLADGPELITFTPPQYGRRHADQDAAYGELAADLLAYTFVLVGTALDESMLWHHVELREARLSKAAKEFRPRSFIVCPQLALPRQGLLEQYKITWIPSTAEVFANTVLSTLGVAAKEGHESLRRELDLGSDLRTNVRAVSELVAGASKHRTEYLLGEHPTWADLTNDRAAPRSSDQAIADLCRRSLRDRQARDPANVLVLSGTGGAGKSTSLMRAALLLSAEGESVGWVGTDTEVSPRTIGDAADQNGFSVLAIDDIDRYGQAVPSLLRRMCAAPIKLVIASLRASKVDVTLDDPTLRGLQIFEHAIPHLTDGDIDDLLDVLDREHRLGKLKGLSRDEQRQKFREHAGRQLLVAMIEATSGERFEEKVMREWAELPAQHQLAYSMIAISGALGIGVSRSELLLACGPVHGMQAAEALAALADRRIAVYDPESNLYRPRHRVIAETLVDEIRKDGKDLAGVLESLSFAVSSGVSTDMNPTARPRRLLKIILNHDYVFRHGDVEAGRRIYEAVEENLNWDHHYWLQRGTFELQEGSLKFAEQCLNQARSLQPNDPLVDTAYAHMLLRKAVLCRKGDDRIAREFGRMRAGESD
jgi:hypothetical protein